MFYARESLVGAADGCDLLIFGDSSIAEDQDQKIAAFGSSYRGASLTRLGGQKRMTGWFCFI